MLSGGNSRFSQSTTALCGATITYLYDAAPAKPVTGRSDPPVTPLHEPAPMSVMGLAFVYLAVRGRQRPASTGLVKPSPLPGQAGIAL
jgi:hypothetical protein